MGKQVFVLGRALCESLWGKKFLLSEGLSPSPCGETSFVVGGALSESLCTISETNCQPLVRKLLRDADGGLHVNGEMSPQVG